jgi:hypothetical protein
MVIGIAGCAAIDFRAHPNRFELRSSSMKKIFKYQAPVKEKFEMSLPAGAEIIRVDDVDGMFFLWAIVDPDEQTRQVRHFEAYKTGAPFVTDPSRLKYLGFWKIYVQMELCLYVFEVLQ